MDKDNICMDWVLANADSISHPQNENPNQESNQPLPNPNPVSVQDSAEENDDKVRDFERTIQEAKLKLMRSLQVKLANVTEASETEILNLKKRLHASEIRNSELSQENSKLREEKRRCELSTEMAQLSASSFERQLQEMTRKKTELESTVEEKTRENSTLKFLLEEKEAQVDKLRNSVQAQNSLSSAPILEEQSLQEIPTGSVVSQSFEAQEIQNLVQIRIRPLAELMEISENMDARNEDENRNLLSNVQTTQEKSPHHSHAPEQIFSRENMEEQDEEENCQQFLCENPSTSKATKQKVPKEKETNFKRKSESPQIESLLFVAPVSKSSSFKERENVSPPQRAGNRFEKSISLQLKRQKPILKPSPLTKFESHDKDDSEKTSEDEPEPLTKRSRSSFGASSSSLTSVSTKRSSKGKSQTSIESVLTVPEIYRINYGFTNNWELENCQHARDFWYDSAHSNVRKFLIRFYDDKEYEKEKILHVKRQKNLEEPKIKYKKLRHLEKKFESLSQKIGSGTGFRLFLDVRDFNIFSPKMTSFFKNFGRFVTHFSFGRRLFSFDEVSASQLLNFILEKFPNLEYLAINDGMLKQIDQPLRITSEKTLEHLKIIRLMTVGYRIDTPIIIELLLHAPALEKIYGIPLHCLYEIQLYFQEVGNSNLPLLFQKQDGEISMDFVKQGTVIRHIYDKVMQSSFHCNPKNFLSDILTLQHLNPPLEFVDARIYFVRDPAMRQICLEKWSEILNSIKTQVKSLTIEPYQMKKFPRLENLHSLHFDMDTLASWSKSTFGYFPPGFDLQHKFPQLKVVEIGMNEKSSQFLRGHQKKTERLFHSHFPLDVFRPLQTFDKVERLNLLNFAPPSCIQSLKELFPRITILQLTLETVDMSNVLPKIYKFWPGLKQLILAVNFSSHVNYNLDSAFTGISFSKCQILHEQIQQKPKSSLDSDGKSIAETLKKHKLNLSIRDLKDLTLLKIVLYTREREKLYEIEDGLMSPVSGIYGFGPDKMPGLKVVLGFDERMTTAEKKCVKRMLEPMKSYLTIDD